MIRIFLTGIFSALALAFAVLFVSAAATSPGPVLRELLELLTLCVIAATLLLDGVKDDE